MSTSGGEIWIPPVPALPGVGTQQKKPGNAGLFHCRAVQRK
jgi:hypothetical protein